LREVHPAVQEGPFGKFPRLSKPPPGHDDRFAQCPEDQRTTVAVELDNIFAGEGSWLAHHNGQRLIQGLHVQLGATVVRLRSRSNSVKTEIGEIQSVTSDSGKGLPAAKTSEPVGDLNGPGSTEP
jgi:hypothetical protein